MLEGRRKKKRQIAGTCTVLEPAILSALHKRQLGYTEEQRRVQEERKMLGGNGECTFNPSSAQEH